jgi:hypothetical protein
MSEVLERTLPELGLLRYEEFDAGEWLTKKGEPAKIGKRRYSLNDEDYDAVSAIVGTLPKEALIRWAEDHGARGAIVAQEQGALEDVPLDEVIKVVRSLKLGAEAVKDEAAERGDAVHLAFHTLATMGTVPVFADYPPKWRGWIKGVASAWLKLDPKPIEAEFMVCHPELHYAGRPDLLCFVDGQLTLLDYKSSLKGVIYEQAHYQTRGYADCFPFCGYPEPERILIVAVRADGEVLLEDCVVSSTRWQRLVALFNDRREVEKLRRAQAKVQALRASEKG